MNIDLILICARRPGLLNRTLESFYNNLFKYFSVVNVYANIDPIFGTQDDQAECKKIIYKYYPKANITEPKQCSFGLAVKSSWLKTKSEYVLHLEDDWVLNEKITPESIFPLFTDNIKCLSFISKYKNWNGKSEFHERKIKKKFFGIPYYYKKQNIFTTSPAFLDGGFARTCAKLLNPDLDPEKQFYNNLNPKLQVYVNDYKNKFLIGKKIPADLIEDIGRNWRDGQGINKKTIDGKSVWS